MSADTVLKPGTPINLDITSANTEYTCNLPAGCEHFSFQCRQANDIFFAFVAGVVAGGAAGIPTAPYLTLKSGSAFSSPDKLALKPGQEALYFAAAAGSLVVEIMPWIPG